MTHRKLDAIERFIEFMGGRAESEGMPRISGRMIGLFVVHGGPFSFSEIAERLKISRGSVSTNARILRELGMIERTHIPGDRQDYYELADDPYRRLLEGYVHRMQESERRIDALLETETDLDGEARKRLEGMREFYGRSINATQSNMDSWQE